MFSSESLLHFAQSIPGFYCYRPVPTDINSFSIQEICYHIEQSDHIFIFSIYFDGKVCTHGEIDIIYNDKSICSISDEDKDFQSILSYKNRLIHSFNKFLIEK